MERLKKNLFWVERKLERKNCVEALQITILSSRDVAKP